MTGPETRVVTLALPDFVDGEGVGSLNIIRPQLENPKILKTALSRRQSDVISKASGP